MPDPEDHPVDRVTALRRLRHDLAGAYNELRLCTEVLRMETDRDQALEWTEADLTRCGAVRNRRGPPGIDGRMIRSR
jgi:hypothetical protein